MGDNRSEADIRAAMTQVDDVLVVNWISVENNDYRKALCDLVTNAIKEHNDPCVSPVAAEREAKIERLEREIGVLKAQLAAAQIGWA